MAAVKALQQWCKIQCDGYRDVAVTNMTTSFRDGLAFCALIHKHRPDLINFDKLSKENVYENNQLAFRVAEEELGIPALLDAEDMVALKVPDRLSILTYVSQYYNYFHGRSPIGGLGGVKRPAEDPTLNVAEAKRPADVPALSASGKKNQPVTAKVYGSPKADPEPKSKILVERTNRPGTLSSNCTICNNHVHLVQRHLVDGKLYHRNCFRCHECSTILLSGTYKPGKEPNTFICKSHQDTQKSPTAQTPQVMVLTRDTQPRSTQTQKPPTPQVRALTRDAQPQPAQTQKNLTPQVTVLTRNIQNQPAQTQKPPTPQSRVLTRDPQPQPTQPTLKLLMSPGNESTPSKPSSVGVVNKTASPFSPVLAKAMLPTSEAKADQKVQTETLKSPSSTILKTQEARQRFFEVSSSPASNTPVTKPASASPANEKPTTGTGAGRGTVNSRFLPQAGNLAKENKEKQNDDEKQRAKTFISKLVMEETNKPSSPLGTNVIKKTSPGDAGTKGHTRVLLKPMITDVELGISKMSGSHEVKDKNSASPLPIVKDGEAAPSDWRARLKPLTKDTKPASSKDTTPPGKPKTSPQTSEPHSKSWLLSPSTTSVSTSKSSSKSPSTTSREESTAAPSGKAGDICKKPSVGKTSSSDSSMAVKPQKLQKKPDYIPQDEILKELKEIKDNLDELEKQGVELEKRLRECEDEGEEDVLANDLMVEWFNLIRSKQLYIRRESELVYIGRSQDLEEEQPNVEAELRRLMEKPDHLKTSRDRKREEELMAKLVEIVNDRNAIVDGLDDDRLREEEEDEQLNKMMQDLDTKKEKKKKSSFSRFFGW